MTRTNNLPLVLFGGVAVLLAIFSLLPEGTFIGLSSDFWRGVLLGILIGVAMFGRPRAFTSTD